MAETPNPCRCCGQPIPDGPQEQPALTFETLRQNDQARVPVFTISSQPDAEGRRFRLGEGFELDEAAQLFAQSLNQLLAQHGGQG